MNKKTKKQIQVLSQKIQQLQKQLAGAKQQSEPGEVARLEQELASAHEKLQKLRAEG